MMIVIFKTSIKSSTLIRIKYCKKWYFHTYQILSPLFLFIKHEVPICDWFHRDFILIRIEHCSIQRKLCRSQDMFYKFCIDVFHKHVPNLLLDARVLQPRKQQQQFGKEFIPMDSNGNQIHCIQEDYSEIKHFCDSGIDVFLLAPQCLLRTLRILYILYVGVYHCIHEYRIPFQVNCLFILNHLL